MKEMKQIKKQLREENNKNKEIMQQHEDLFKLLENSSNSSDNSYNYGG